MNPSLLTKKEVAEYLNVSIRTVEHYCSTGKLAFIQLPGFKRFDSGAIKKFIEGRTFQHRQ
jgi:excisionase family DNA binding protein